VTVGTGIAATDVLTTGALLDVAARHELFQTERFNGGLFRMFMHAGQHRDLWDDTTFINSAIYDASDRFRTYRLGRWFDIEFLVSSEVYREDVDGTENQSTGVVYVSPVFGRNSHSVFTFANPGGSGKFGTKFLIVDTPDTSNLRLSRRYISWKGMYAAGVTRATSVIDLMTGATDIGITIT
jgi:N4-gp56 family major capsid protein